MTLPDLSSWTETDLDAMAAEVAAERARRWALEQAPQRAQEVQEAAAVELDRIAATWHAAHEGTGTLDAPVEWEAPSGAHDAWPLGAVVTVDGETYESLIPNNATRPGDPTDPQSGRWWRKVSTSADPDPWAAGRMYLVGDRATHAGSVYRCIYEHYAQLPPDDPRMHSTWTKEG